MIPAFTLTFDTERKINDSRERIATPSVEWKLGRYWHPNHHNFMFYTPRFIASMRGKIVDVRTQSGMHQAIKFLEKKLGLKQQYKRWYAINQSWLAGFFYPKNPSAIGTFTGRHVFLSRDIGYHLLSEVMLINPIHGHKLVWLIVEAPDTLKPIDIL